MTRAALVARTAVALAGAMVIGGIAVAAAGLDPISTLGVVVDQALGSSFGIHDSLSQAVPITLAALGVAVAFRASLFNLGGEGQILVGALAAVLVALGGRGLPAAALVPATLLAGVLAGAAWGAIAGALRARLGLSEIITTIMLNFIGLWIVSYLIHGPLMDPHGAGYPYTERVVPAARIGSIGDTVPVGALLCVVVAACVWVLLDRSRTGLRIKDVGEGEAAAAFAGVRVGRVVLGVMALAGALGGLAGAAELTGDQYRVSDSFSPGWGYDAIAVALIGRGTAFGTLATGMFFGALRSGIDGAQATANVPAAVAQIVQGVTVLLLVAANSDVVGQAVRGAVRSVGRLRARAA